ncbi:tol-pal system protein YbgF [Lysobacter niastensis]|uniref:Cell division coordinator CpoB n=1 Tax=Lysobacter niastensis TaxID=380629 RepID=A0ABS0BBI7_9GAMM|nr:tol-pal system protein YbgF [Lysobacter niastensis]MBF6025668.1 tol-pal system protein YbgF [Lysobacter niastensis]
MRKFALPIAFAAALVAAAPAFAQRASLADRVTALEQRAADNQGNVDLLNQVSQLKSEIQALRSQVEELQQLNQQLQQSGKAQYLDLDGRLNQLESGAVTPPPAAPATPAKAPATKPAAGKPSASTTDRQPAVYGDKGAIAKDAGERSAYDTAFNALKAGQYAESARLFQAFLEAYPNGSYTPNALYWLGESYYVTQNYQLAAVQFQALLDRFPTHDKAPGAMLKVGLSQLGLKQVEAAERTLAEVSTRYPGSDAARTASDRLNAIQLGRLR